MYTTGGCCPNGWSSERCLPPFARAAKTLASLPRSTNSSMHPWANSAGRAWSMPIVPSRALTRLTLATLPKSAISPTSATVWPAISRRGSRPSHRELSFRKLNNPKPAGASRRVFSHVDLCSPTEIVATFRQSASRTSKRRLHEDYQADQTFHGPHPPGTRANPGAGLSRSDPEPIGLARNRACPALKSGDNWRRRRGNVRIFMFRRQNQAIGFHLGFLPRFQKPAAYGAFGPAWASFRRR